MGLHTDGARYDHVLSVRAQIGADLCVTPQLALDRSIIGIRAAQLAAPAAELTASTALPSSQARGPAAAAAPAPDPAVIQVSIRPFPWPATSEDLGAASAAAFLNLLLVFAFLAPTRAAVAAVVQEKELRLREGMRVLGEEQGGQAVLSMQDHVIGNSANTWVGAEGPVHAQGVNGTSCGCTQPVICFPPSPTGLDDLSFWTSWAVTHWSTLAASGLLCTAMCAYPFPSSSLLLLALFFTLLAAALVSFRSGRMCAPSALSLIRLISPSPPPTQLLPVHPVLNHPCCRHRHSAGLCTGCAARLHHSHGRTIRGCLLVVGLPAAPLGSLHVCGGTCQLGAGQPGYQRPHTHSSGEREGMFGCRVTWQLLRVIW